MSTLKPWAARARPKGFRIAENRTPPRRVTRVGTDTIEPLLAFETDGGWCNGVVRLTEGGGAPQAWTLLTALDQIKGHEEQFGRTRRQDKVYSRDFRGPNWLDQYKASAEYVDREPAVLVVGGGQAGLSIAARLTQLQIDTLIVDRWPRIGDNWRKRYHALVLHNQTHVNHLPYMPFPLTWPNYIPKDKIASWFEAYVESQDLNYWTGTDFEGGFYDEAQRRWTVTRSRPARRASCRETSANEFVGEVCHGRDRGSAHRSRHGRSVGAGSPRPHHDPLAMTTWSGSQEFCSPHGAGFRFGRPCRTRAIRRCCGWRLRCSSAAPRARS